MDVPLTWALINSFLSAGRVERIFVHYPLQRCFYDYLVDKGVSKSTLARIIQYPRGPGSQRGILRHFRNHHHHFHVRYFCSSRDKQCRDNGETPRLVSVDVSRRPDHHRRHRRRAN